MRVPSKRACRHLQCLLTVLHCVSGHQELLYALRGAQTDRVLNTRNFAHLPPLLICNESSQSTSVQKADALEGYGLFDSPSTQGEFTVPRFHKSL